MEQVNTVIIGAGAIGLAIAYELSKRDSDIVVVEKENSFGKHTSSRNSEVIHAGLYYDPGSLKAEMCVHGNELLYSYLQENGIPYKKTGKIIVSTSSEEDVCLRKYYTVGTKNGCMGIEYLSMQEVQALEPKVKCNSGLYIPSTGIFDTHQYMQNLALQVEQKDAFIVYGMEVRSIEKDCQHYVVGFSNGEFYKCKTLINSAGLWADGIAKLAGMEIENLGIKQHWCKGEYYKTTKIHGVNHLVYPVADPKGVFLGIHLTINLNGEVRFGPNAFYLDNIDYKFDESYFEEFYAAISRYIDIERSDLMPDDTGIRAKLQGPGEGFRDFYIREESEHGLPGFINLIGMESPGLTSSLAIAQYVANMVHS